MAHFVNACRKESTKRQEEKKLNQTIEGNELRIKTVANIKFVKEKSPLSKTYGSTQVFYLSPNGCKVKELRDNVL